MKKTPIISKAKKKRLERFTLIKKDFMDLMKLGSDKTEVVKVLCKKHKASSATIYLALK